MLDAHARLAELVGTTDPLRRRLAALSSVLAFANTGAHPDDEQNGLLAALRFGWGLRTVVISATRGEGGQNILGPERDAALGVLRTREMEIAAARIGAGIVWLGHGTGDPIHDFGFSQSGEDTLARWGEALLLERLVRAYRSERPDIVLPTFLDVPGQHGHHRAMTRSAFAAIAMAADPSVRTGNLPPWQVSKFYLPAWSGAGSSYDDELPPPAATLVLEFPDADPVTSASYAQIGEYSRAAHASQGMGRWRDAQPDRWALHLAWSAVGEQESDLRDHLPADLAELAATPGAPAVLAEAALAVSRTQAAWPDVGEIGRRSQDAGRLIAAAIAAAEPDWQRRHCHRLLRKCDELAALVAGDTETIVAAPPRAAEVSVIPEVVIVDLSHPCPIDLSTEGGPGLALPAGWRVEWRLDAATLTPPALLDEGAVDIPVLAGGDHAVQESLFAYPHTGPLSVRRRQSLRVLALTLARPASVIAVLAGPGDRLGLLLAGAGLNVVEILEGAIEPAELGAFTTIVVGLQAFATRGDLVAHAASLLRFVEHGGHLVTLMHRPQDRWPVELFPIEIGSPSVRYRACTPDAPVEMSMPNHPLLAGPNRIVHSDWAGWHKERGLYFAKAWGAAYQPLLAVADAGEAPLSGALLSARIGAGRHTHTGLAVTHQLDHLVPGAFRLMANLVQPA